MPQVNLVGVAALLGLGGAAYAQIAQDRPELCSSLNPVPLPLGMNAVLKRPGVDLTIRLTDQSSKTIYLPSPDAIRQVCPLPDYRVAAFGVLRGGDGYGVWILSERDGTILDTMGSRDPRLSPDGRWLIYRERYPTRSAGPFEQYLLYDLARSPAENRLAGSGSRYPPGRLVYPVTAGRTRLEDLKVPADRYHAFVGKAFFWSADSKTVVFADRVGAAASIVVIKIDGDDPTAYVHALTAQEVCAGREPRQDLASSVELTAAYVAEGGSRDLLVRFSPQGWLDSTFACRNSLPLNSSSLTLAEPELYQSENARNN